MSYRVFIRDADPDEELKLWRRDLGSLMRFSLFHPSDRLRIWRHASEHGRLTIAEAARMAHVSPATWGSWETERFSPRPIAAQVLQELTGIPADHWA